MAQIVDYIDLVSLSEAKLFLRVDDDITETDSEITILINSACNLVENYTQHYLKPQTKTFQFNERGLIRMYAHPVNSIVETSGFSVSNQQLYSIYSRTISSLDQLEANIGYTDTSQVKDIFKYAVLETVKLWFYGSESETVIKGYIPSSVMAILAPERRFVF
jgi:hypothetical protein